MKIGFITFPIPGHFNPMSVLARQLQSRNHDVVMLSLSSGESLARAAGLAFAPFAEKEFPADKSGEILESLSRQKGPEGLQFTVKSIAAANEVKWRTLPNLLSSTGIDALVVDNCDFYGETIPMRLGMPYAVVSNALHFDYSGYTPLCVYDCAHENTPEAINRNRQGISKFTQILIDSNAELIAQTEGAGIKPNWADPSSLYSDRLSITQCPREFDFGSSHRPQHFHYTGPFHEGKGRLDFPFPWDQLTGEPIVYASMGTIQVGNADVFNIIATAAAKHKGLQLVLAIGNLLRPEQIGRVPKNAIVVNQAPQLELLKKASVCITHAGFNTVLEALTQGVPQIAIPVTNDQPGVAARIADKETGKATSLDSLNVSKLSTLLDEVLNNPLYRDNSRRIQKAIVEKNGISVAADLLEQTFGLTKSTETSVQKTA
jgi:MGT family glycosyltransferase